MAEPIFLDVNVFMYAAGAPHPCKQVISADRDFEHLDFVTRIEPLAYSSDR